MDGAKRHAKIHGSTDHDTTVETTGHHTKHEHAGADEISLTGLLGLTGTDQTPATHASSKHDSSVIDTVTKLLANNYRQIVNRLAGILATVSGWNTDPTNLANATDNNWAVATGIGVFHGSGAHEAYIQFDMGAVYNVDIRLKALIGNNFSGGQTLDLVLMGSEDGSTYYNCIGVNYFVQKWEDNATEIIFARGFLRARYIRLYIGNDYSTAADLKLAIYEIQAIDVGL